MKSGLRRARLCSSDRERAAIFVLLNNCGDALWKRPAVRGSYFVAAQ